MMSSCVNDEFDRQTELVADSQCAAHDFGVIIKEEPEDSGYERVVDGDDDNDDSDDNTIYTGELADEVDDVPTTAKTGDDHCAEVKDSSTALVDDDGEPIDVVIKLEPDPPEDENERPENERPENERPEAEVDEDRSARPVEEDDKNFISLEDEDLSESITTTVIPTEITRGLFKGDKIFECEVCEKTFGSEHHLDVHLRRHKFPRTGKDVQPSKTGEDVQTSDPGKDIQASNPGKDGRAGAKGVEKDYKCSICGLGLGSVTSLNRHEKEHSSEREFKCRYCEKTFMRDSGRKDHEKRHLGIRNYKCKNCTRTFYSSSELKSHLKTHKGEDAFSCKVCLKGFTTEPERDAHQAVHGGDHPFRCSSCDASFKEIGDLYKHEKHHDGDLCFKCLICNKAFSKRSSLSSHKKIHAARKNFKCTICNYTSYQKSLVDAHMRVHTGEKPYKCMYCQRAFSGISSCKRHERSHRGEKRYPCEFCGKRFVCCGDRRVHERQHTGEKPFKCRYCGMGFIKSYPRTVHERKHEEELPAHVVAENSRRRQRIVETNQIEPTRTQKHSSKVIAKDVNQQLSVTVKPEHTSSDEDLNAPVNLRGCHSLDRSDPMEAGTLVSSNVSQGQLAESGQETVYTSRSSVSAQHDDSVARFRSPDNVDHSSIGQEDWEQHGLVLGRCPPQMTSYLNHHRHHLSNGLEQGQHNRVEGFSPPLAQYVKQEARHNGGLSEMELSSWHYGSNDMRPPVCYPLPNDLSPPHQLAPHLNGAGHVYFQPTNHETYLAALTAWQQFQQGYSSTGMGHPLPPLMGPMYPAYNGYF